MELINDLEKLGSRLPRLEIIVNITTLKKKLSWLTLIRLRINVWIVKSAARDRTKTSKKVRKGMPVVLVRKT